MVGDISIGAINLFYSAYKVLCLLSRGKTIQLLIVKYINNFTLREVDLHVSMHNGTGRSTNYKPLKERKILPRVPCSISSHSAAFNHMTWCQNLLWTGDIPTHPHNWLPMVPKRYASQFMFSSSNYCSVPATGKLDLCHLLTVNLGLGNTVVGLKSVL